jgi:hypothetical protein
MIELKALFSESDLETNVNEQIKNKTIPIPENVKDDIKTLIKRLGIFYDL